MAGLAMERKLRSNVNAASCLVLDTFVIELIPANEFFLSKRCYLGDGGEAIRVANKFNVQYLGERQVSRLSIVRKPHFIECLG